MKLSKKKYKIVAAASQDALLQLQLWETEEKIVNIQGLSIQMLM